MWRRFDLNEVNIDWQSCVRSLIFLCLFCSSVAMAESAATSKDDESSVSQDKPGFTPLINAKSTGFSKDGGQQIFDGDVIAIGPQSLVTADKIVIDEKKKKVTADGHVIILSNNQIVTGDTIELWTDTGDIKVDNAILVMNDPTEADRIAKQILGYSSQEIEFEAHRHLRLDEIDGKKRDMRYDVRMTVKKGGEVSESSIKQYAQFLEQQDLIAKQENPAFSQMSEERRQTLKKRREYWAQSRLGDSIGAPGGSLATYFKITGSALERTNGNDLKALEGTWTSCHCDKDETPPWGFSSNKIEAQPGGYATFSDAVLEVKGLPVLYLPWFRLPIKDRRQSGFLPPTITSDSQSGSVYSQPLFLDLGTDKDITLKTEFFERRGTKFALENRYQRKKYSGYQLNLEMMRDRVWLNKIKNREDLEELYFSGLDAARRQAPGTPPDDISRYTERDYAARLVSQRDYWEKSGYKDCVSTDPIARLHCEQRLSSDLRHPANSNRGFVKWKAQERLGERLSVIGTGELYSDRQYSSDLYTPESFQAGFDTGSGERPIDPVRLQFHNDQKNFYLGLGGQFGDYVRTNDNFEGFQLPTVIKTHTRLIPIAPSLLPAYGTVSLDQYRIVRKPGSQNDNEERWFYLGNAWYRRAQFVLVAPVSTKGAVQVDHFTELEARTVEFDQKKQYGQTSILQSMKTGFRFQLPIDGKAEVPGWLGGSKVEGKDGSRYIQHLMNWSMSVSARPNVVRKGDYGDEHSDQVGATPRYFMATDAAAPYQDDNVRAEDYMTPFNLFTFATTHRWKIFSEYWQFKDMKEESLKNKSGSEIDNLTWEERARKELLYTTDKPIKVNSKEFGQDQSQWFTNRYDLLASDYSEPANFSANISYDYLKEKARREEGRTVANRPWTEPEATVGLSALGWNLTDTSKYNIYDRIATKHSLNLVPPSIFSTSMNYGLVLENSVVEDGGGKSIQVKTEQTATFATSLTRPVMTTVSWAKREYRGQGIPLHKNKIGLVYASRTNCWGMGFSREKDYGVPQDAASYVLQLNIIFMGQQRDLPDMSQQVDRVMKRDQG
jgi:lipopolysaccharide export system protein LptA